MTIQHVGICLIQYERFDPTSSNISFALKLNGYLVSFGQPLILNMLTEAVGYPTSDTM